MSDFIYQCLAVAAFLFVVGHLRSAPLSSDIHDSEDDDDMDENFTDLSDTDGQVNTVDMEQVETADDEDLISLADVPAGEDGDGQVQPQPLTRTDGHQRLISLEEMARIMNIAPGSRTYAALVRNFEGLFPITQDQADYIFQQNGEVDDTSSESSGDESQEELAEGADDSSFWREDRRTTTNREIADALVDDLDFWDKRHRDDHGAHLLHIKDVDRGMHAVIEEGRQLGAGDGEVVLGDSYVYEADSKSLVAKIPCKSDIKLVKKLKPLMLKKVSVDTEKNPELALRASPAKRCFTEIFKLARGRARSAKRVIISAGKADLSFAPAYQDQWKEKHRSAIGSTKWPTVVVESGLLINDRDMLEKVQWWFDASHGDTRVVLVTQLATQDGHPHKLRITQYGRTDDGHDVQLINLAHIWVRPEERWRTWPGGFSGDDFHAEFLHMVRGREAGLVLSEEQLYGGAGFTEKPMSRVMILDEQDLTKLAAEMWNSSHLWEDARNHEWEPWRA
ncbi:hypothetical protein NLU13_3229 [Sarocladium strictum]|uniref:Transmembrane protein n=1 Tax=Sarocladium strictum TaxID=5046 RepID=A0AA39GMF6_SARSR|nr:hypothetical protein NLU13_3229 [Sarocladium strictum]